MLSTELYRKIKKALACAGAFAPDFEAREIIREYCGESLLPPLSGNIDPREEEKILAALERRLGGEPLQYIFGKWEFYGYDFIVCEGVLIPRPETELIVDTAVEIIKKDDVFIDLCSGTGCIPISISLKTGAKGYAAELYDGAYSVLERNIERHGVPVTAVKLDVTDMGACEGFMPGLKFSLITSNPPYLTAQEMEELSPEVKREPFTALYGGEDGLDIYRKMIPLWSKRLESGGLFICETGDRQAREAARIMTAAGLDVRVIKDYGGIERVVAGRRVSI